MNAPVQRASDPAERGLRGAMSATLILEAIVLLLAIPVARNTGSGTGAGGVIAICVLALVAIALCAFAGRTWFVWAGFALQVLTIAGWAISTWLGLVGVVFGLVWVALYWFRQEYRRRLAAGTLPGAPPAGDSGGDVG